MGCATSKEPPRTAPQGTADKKKTDRNSTENAPTATAQAGSGGKLLDKYTLGKVLGQGAFGVVYKCKKKGTEEEYAVKMIDQVETPLVEIKREAEMLQKLAHPTVIKLHDVYYEKVFVCMVLEFYRGGDMIQGMMAHWKSKGMIPMSSVKHLSKQMHAACAWIHSQACVHRDVKGDNFMMDKPDVENPQQRLYLSDFGTVREVAPGERITQKCGTKNYWPPEFFRLNYGIKVDCWAVGVVMFGLVSGKFPFKGEDDVKTKKLVIPKRCPDDGQELIHALLERDENKRMDCSTALRHSFLQDIADGGGPRIGVEVSHKETDFAPEMKENGANAGIAQRRAELVDRLQKNADGGGKKKPAEGTQPMVKSYLVTDPHTERSMTFEWRLPAQVLDMTSSFANAKPVPTFDMINREVTEESVRQQLLDHNVKVDGFGKGSAKQFGDFVSEIQNGSCRLLLDATKHKHVVRAVDIVLLRITYGAGSSKRILIETTPGLRDGTTVTGPSLPGNVKTPVENALQAAERLCKEMIGLGDCKIQWDIANVEAFEETDDSPAYPGIQTVYRNEIMCGQVTATEDAIFQRIGVAGGSKFEYKDGRKLRTFEWLSEAQCQTKNIRIASKGDASDFSALVYPPIGLEEEELNEFLSKNHIDTSKWGQGTFKTLADFSEELVKGESTLIKQQNGRVARVVDIVVLYLVRQETGEVLVEAQEKYKDSVQQLNRLPAIKRRSDEHQFFTARRMVTKYLNLDDNRVIIDPMDVKIVEEEQASKSFHGLSTIYRKRFMKAVLAPDTSGE